jgi:hypothetical protein
MWHHYVPESGNWHDGTFTRWIAALSAAPNPFLHIRQYSNRIWLFFPNLPHTDKLFASRLP